MAAIILLMIYINVISKMCEIKKGIVLLVWLWYLNVVHLFTELEQGRWNDCPENHSTSLEVRLSLHLCKAERLPKWSQYGTMSSYRGAKKFLIYCDFLC